jgi:anti-sigma factor RsiW
MRCADLAERLTEFMEGELSPDEESAALEHLASCEHCETVLSETRDVVNLARDHGRPELTEPDRARMLDSITSEAKLNR